MDYARVLKLPQYFRNLQRLSDIAGVFIKHGFGDLIDRIQLSRYVETGIRVFYPAFLLEKRSSLALHTRLRLAFEELGPTFIKFGQIISTRPDIFPGSITDEFRKLQDTVPPFPESQVTALIEKEIGKPIDQIFSAFDSTALASASIAQVHKATLLGGQTVVVKVQRPNIERTIDTDLEILAGLAALTEEHLPETRQYAPSRLVEEFSRTLRLECDFRREAQNLKKFKEGISGEPNTIVPTVFDDLSGRRVLVEEYIDGFRADDLTSLNRCKIDKKDIATTITRVVLRSIFEHRFFHADPHPGNVFITPTGAVAFLDFGAMGRIDRIRINQILQLLVAVVTRDLSKMLRVLEDYQTVSFLSDEVSLRNQLSEILDNYLGQSLKRLDLTGLLSEIFEVTRRYGIKLPPDLLLIAKSLTTLQHIGSIIDPDFNPEEHIGPYLMARLRHHQSDYHTYINHISEISDSYLKLFTELPSDIRAILRSLSRDNLNINTTFGNFEEIKQHQSRLLNRLLMVIIGLGLLTIGIAMTSIERSRIDISVSYVLIVLGALILFLSWIAVRRSGGTS